MVRSVFGAEEGSLAEHLHKAQAAAAELFPSAAVSDRVKCRPNETACETLRDEHSARLRKQTQQRKTAFSLWFKLLKHWGRLYESKFKLRCYKIIEKKQTFLVKMMFYFRATKQMTCSCCPMNLHCNDVISKNN